jgi:hypothetical protein
MILQQPFAISTSPTGFNYYSPFTIQSGQVPSTQTDFPVLFSVTDSRFKTVANGGHVLDAEGDDIRPYSDSGITTAITGYEKVFYDGTNGILEFWVKRSSVADNLVTYFAYGNAALTSDGSSTTTWSNSFSGVYHLKDGTTLSVSDSTGAHNGSNNGVTAATGKIDGGGGFASASSQFFRASGMDSTAITYSCWVNGTTFPNDYNGVVTNGSGSVDYKAIFVKSNGKLYCIIKNTTISSYDGTGSHTLSTGTWYLLHMTYDSSAGLVGYVNAASDGTAAANGNINTTANFTAVGRQESTSSRYFNGTMDEARVASVARSADWITTEYNNQSAPGTFQTLGTEVPL